ncbi:hypothetical protein M011DRAFT_395504 [Sporormia fimetaria CBS 119925]|uniref:PWWP domain-containing protein n=1 Tax=Sporormia fimetaria CBS 119925 TaxID=1340428 RepID=A0A6A6VJ43_9PLEO|nr:hypothetical protein M011DRAFT_395504 [Sporormia fimetaria CBS 119925]
MADEAVSPTTVDVPKTVEEDTRVSDAPVDTGAAEAEPAPSGDVASSAAAAEASAPSPSKQDAPADDTNTSEAPAATEAGESLGGVVPRLSCTAAPQKAVATPKASNRRKSGAGVKSAKKKAGPKLVLDAKPGNMYMVSMTGYPAWPVVICDEDMLPESLLSKRPVSAVRIDGTYRDDFKDDGKHVKDRRYAIMFLGTNEFAWEVNTSLQPIDIEKIKSEVEAGNNGKRKKTRALWEAYQVAAEEHDLDWFKSMLMAHEQALAKDLEEQAEKAAEDAKKQDLKEKKAKRKSTATVKDDDTDMEDADAAEQPTSKKAKGTKRKKQEETDDEQPEKPVKTPKMKVKLNNKPPKEASTAKKETKRKTKATKSESEESEPKPEEKVLSPEEQREKQHKQILYLRHRLQKGFLSRNEPPQEAEMASMNDYLKQLEEHKDLEAENIVKTKIHKVLKGIVKLDSIPKEDVYNFKKRCLDTLKSWDSVLHSAAAAPNTNGVKEGDEKSAEVAKADEGSPMDTSDKPVNGTEEVKAEAADTDVAMKDAPAETAAPEETKSEETKPAEAEAGTANGTTA